VVPPRGGIAWAAIHPTPRLRCRHRATEPVHAVRAKAHGAAQVTALHAGVSVRAAGNPRVILGDQFSDRTAWRNTRGRASLWAIGEADLGGQQASESSGAFLPRASPKGTIDPRQFTSCVSNPAHRRLGGPGHPNPSPPFRSPDSYQGLDTCRAVGYTFWGCHDSRPPAAFPNRRSELSRGCGPSWTRCNRSSRPHVGLSAAPAKGVLGWVRGQIGPRLRPGN